MIQMLIKFTVVVRDQKDIENRQQNDSAQRDILLCPVSNAQVSTPLCFAVKTEAPTSADPVASMCASWRSTISLIQRSTTVTARDGRFAESSSLSNLPSGEMNRGDEREAG